MAFRYTPKQLEVAYKVLGDTEEVNILRAHIDSLERTVELFTNCAHLHINGGRGDLGLVALVEKEREFQKKVEEEACRS